MTTPLTTGLWFTAGTLSLAIGAVFGKYSLPETVTINNRIQKLPKAVKKSGKIFRTIEHLWNKKGDSVLTPFVLFRCVQSKDNDACGEIEEFTAITFKYGVNPFAELFRCTNLNNNRYTPIYYFDQEIKDDATPLDLDWTKLTRGKAEKRKWGKYIVVNLSTSASCGGKIEEYTWTANSGFFNSFFSINKPWSPDSETTNDMSIFIKKTDGTNKQYWWKPVALLNYDFDLNLIKNELQKDS